MKINIMKWKLNLQSPRLQSLGFDAIQICIKLAIVFLIINYYYILNIFNFIIWAIEHIYYVPSLNDI